jgi:hypothetical protein
MIPFLFLILSYFPFSAKKGLLADSPWPSFRGNLNNTGRSIHVGPQTNNLKSLFKQAGNSFSMGTNGTTLYFRSGYNVVAMSAAGKLLWSYGSSGSVSFPPSVGAEGILYFGSGVAVYALFSNGTMKWTLNIGPISSMIGIATDGSIRVITSEGITYALTSEGLFKWKSSFPDGRGTRGMIIGSDNTVYSNNGRYFIAIDATGALKYSVDVGKYYLYFPALDNVGNIYYSENSNTFYLIAISVISGKIMWDYIPKDSNIRTDLSPAIGIDGIIYVNALSVQYPYTGYIYAFDNNGALKWTYSTAPTTALYSSLVSPIVGGDGTIYTAYDRILYALTPSGSLIWQYPISRSNWNNHDSLVIGPDGSLYASTGNGLYVFHDPLPTAQPTPRPTTPTGQPTRQPTSQPTRHPTTAFPSLIPSISPSFSPTPVPSLSPSATPSSIPTIIPSIITSSNPTPKPTSLSTDAPSFILTDSPTLVPSANPSISSSESPSVKYVPKTPSNAPSFYLPSIHLSLHHYLQLK